MSRHAPPALFIRFAPRHPIKLPGLMKTSWLLDCTRRIVFAWPFTFPARMAKLMAFFWCTDCTFKMSLWMFSKILISKSHEIQFNRWKISKLHKKNHLANPVILFEGKSQVGLFLRIDTRFDFQAGGLFRFGTRPQIGSNNASLF
jgi:hypothetical protein